MPSSQLHFLASKNAELGWWEPVNCIMVGRYVARSSKKFRNGRFCNYVILCPLNDDIVYYYVKVGEVSMGTSMPMSRSPGCEDVF